MAGSYLIDPSTFTAAVLMTCMPREKFGEPGVQEVTAAGVKKWTADVAVTFPPAAPGMKAVSEVISVTLVADHDPGLPQGTPVLFHGLRMGISAPEKRESGRVVGGKPFFSADAIRSAIQPAQRREAA